MASNRTLNLHCNRSGRNFSAQRCNRWQPLKSKLARSTLLLCLAIVSCHLVIAAPAPAKPWSTERANEWYAKQSWLVGSNFLPSTAVNELEMWQPETFDLPTVDRELGWAESLGMNTMRVFLHNLLWQTDSEAFLHRVDEFLKVADRHHIRITFVLLDSVWDPHPHAGPQPAPIPHVHNSRWVQAPGADVLLDEAHWERDLRPYIVGVVHRFADDPRVLMWDLMNEPDNDNSPYRSAELQDKAARTFRLLNLEWSWAQSARPTQPLTSGVWKGDWTKESSLSKMARFQLDHSDVITFHSYDKPEETARKINALRRYHRPVVCTEYMARPRGSTFASILPLLKKENVGAYNWGFVNGKSQTIYAWNTWDKPETHEPAVWFHDIFYADGRPYDQQETDLIRKLTSGDVGKQ